jgi:hypothetical protein
VDELYGLDSNLKYNLSKSTSSKNDTNEYAHSCLDAVMAAVAKDDEHNETCKTDKSKTSCFTFGGRALTYEILV